MAVFSVAQLKEVLSNAYSDDDLLVVAWWDKGDIENDATEILESEGSEVSEDAILQVWQNVAYGFDDFIDELSSQANEELFYQVQRNI